MEWVQIDRYHMVFDADYTISKSWSGERVTYSAWSPDEPVDGYWYKLPRLLGCVASRDAAEQLCLDDLSNKKGTPEP